MRDCKVNKIKIRVLITGVAGFIGSTLAKYLISKGIYVHGIDNINNAYDTQLKIDRLENINNFCKEYDDKNFIFSKIDICNYKQLRCLFQKIKPTHIVNLAARAGVRNSIDEPIPYVETNILGFTNILELGREFSIEHLVYASSSSVYGANTSMPFSEEQACDHPLSLYAATKRSNEILAHSYSHLFNLPTTGLRFFTVYGPWGRPDMALYLFAKSIINGEAINIFNNGNHQRDFTYIDDIVDGIYRVLFSPAKPNNDWNSKNPRYNSSLSPYKIYNIGNNKPVKLMEYVSALESSLNMKAKINMMALQDGDVPSTWACIDKLSSDLGYKPETCVEKGVDNFVKWFKGYYNIK